jgi:hypothetical protein
MGNDFEEHKSNFSLFKKLWTEKYPSSRFNHLSKEYLSILPSNIGTSNLICTLKGATPPLEEDVSLVGSHRRICTKLSIISFLCCVRDSSRKFYKGSHVLFLYFSFHERSLRHVRDFFLKRNKLETQFFVP